MFLKLVCLLLAFTIQISLCRGFEVSRFDVSIEETKSPPITTSTVTTSTAQPTQSTTTTTVRPDPPPKKEAARMARYIVHYSGN